MCKRDKVIIGLEHRYAVILHKLHFQSITSHCQSLVIIYMWDDSITLNETLTWTTFTGTFSCVTECVDLGRGGWDGICCAGHKSGNFMWFILPPHSPEIKLTVICCIPGVCAHLFLSGQRNPSSDVVVGLFAPVCQLTEEIFRQITDTPSNFPGLVIVYRKTATTGLRVTMSSWRFGSWNIHCQRWL